MALWMIFAALTVLALIWVLYPMFRPDRVDVDEQTFERAVYRDQLQELERDAERGVINQKEKESALNEVSRRLLGAQSDARLDAKVVGRVSTSTKTTQLVAVVSAIVVTGFSGFLYKSIGNPTLPDQPQEQRIANAQQNRDMDAMILQVQRFLQQNPKDIKGWHALAPALMRAKRYNQASEAFAKIMQLDKPTPPLLVDYAESILHVNKGVPTDQVRAALKAAVAMDKNYAKARVYWALTLAKDGLHKQALEQWLILRGQDLKNVELQAAVQRNIVELESAISGDAETAKIPALDKDQRDAAAAMTPNQRQAMIVAMVERLADRLKEDSNDLGGWQRLIRARMVLGQKVAAASALNSARKTFKDDQEALAELTKLSSELGL